MIRFELEGDAEVRALLKGIDARVRANVMRGMTKATHELQAYVKAYKLTNQVLNVRSGRLRRSITGRIEDSGHEISGIVGTKVEYARIHEFGGSTSAHEIFPRRGKFLAFFSKRLGRMVFTKKVSHPGSKMPERSFLRSALRDREDRIKTIIERAVAAGVLNRADS